MEIQKHSLCHTKSKLNVTVLITAAEGRLGMHLHVFSHCVCKLQFLRYRRTFLYTSIRAINFFRTRYLHIQPQTILRKTFFSTFNWNSVPFIRTFFTYMRPTQQGTAKTHQTTSNQATVPLYSSTTAIQNTKGHHPIINKLNPFHIFTNFQPAYKF